MIIYNVSVNVEDSITQEWVEWMKTTHIPDVMSKGLFVSFQFSKLLSRQDDETGTTFVIQYTATDMEQYETYQRDYAPALQLETKKRFGEKFIAFRTLMETV